MGEKKGKILRIERASIHDGEGTRTVIYTKGCQLRCRWCSTYESQSKAIQIGINQNKCKRCKKCIEICENKAIYVEEETGKIRIDNKKCNNCEKCIEECVNSAIKKYGQELTVEEIMEEIRKDEIFYFHTGGGITISGGEPYTQGEYVEALLKACKEEGINTTIETTLYAEYKEIEKSLKWLDNMYIDIKHMNEEKHKEWTKGSNKIILENIEKIDNTKYPINISIRIPIIPGFNDIEENMIKTIKFCEKLKKLKEVELLPYHRLGMDTYESLGVEYELKDLRPQSYEHILSLANVMKKYNDKIVVKISGKEIKKEI